MQDWRVRGKVAYRLPDDAGSASLDWQQTGEQSQLRLSGPLGVGSTEIHNEGALLSVKRDGIERLYPADAAPWLPGGTLLPVPVDSIEHWLRGVPDPEQPVTALETDNALARRIEQNGWVVEYSDYKDTQGLAMPARLLLTVPRIDLSLKIILRDWEL
jgi:outer membrane lipoprotein LolB